MTVLLAATAGVLAAAGVRELCAGLGVRRVDAGRRRSATGVPRRSPLAALLYRLGRRLAPAASAAVRARIEAAGSGIGPAELMAIKAGAAAVAAGAALACAPLLPGRLGLMALVALPAGGFLAPDVRLRRRARRRSRRLQRELPDVLELLRVCVEAGLPPRRAFAEVGRRHPGLLARELAAAAARMELGESHAAATERLLRRCPGAGIVALVAALRRAHRHGAPLAGALDAQIEQARADGARVVAERAARAAPKIQLVVALLLVPSAMLLIAAAMLPALSWS